MVPPIHMPLRREAANLSRMRSPANSRSNWANDSSTLRVSRPIDGGGIELLGNGHERHIMFEAMEWAEDNGADYIYGLAGNAALDVLVAEIADNLRFHHAKSSQTKLRTYASFTYQASSWKRPRKVVARLECSLQPDTGESV